MDTLYSLRTCVLLLIGPLLLSGCDGFESGTPPNQNTTEQGTTVQFAAPGASVAEQDAAQITVELTTPTPLSSELSVEVLFGEAASSANRLDFGGAFSQEASNRELTRTVTFSSGAENGATRTITFDDLDDGVDSGEEDSFGEVEQVLETAIFKLQALQSEGTAQIGATNRFDLLIGLLDVGAAREQGAAGNFIATQGIVTRAKGAFTRIQDPTGGLVIRQTSGDFYNAVQEGEIQVGDVILVTGTTSFFSGLQQINEGDLSDFEVVSEGNDLPDPETVTVEEVLNNGEEYESKLIRIEGLTTDASGSFSAETNYTVSDGTGDIVLRPPASSDTDIVGKEIPSGEFVFEGILGQFNGGFGGADEPDSGYQLQPVNRSDVSVSEQ